jgi:hypothetical protein
VLTGTQAAVSRAVKSIALLLPRLRTRARVTLTATSGGPTTTATIAVS